MDFPTASGIVSTVKKAEFPIAAAGFFFGVTEKDAEYHANRNESYGWKWRAADFLGHIGVGGSIDGYTARPNLKINPLGFLNMGLAIAIFSWVVGTLFDGKLGDLIAAVGIPLGTGWAVGGFLDPAPSGNIGASNYRETYQGSSTGVNPFLEGAYR